MSKQKNAEFSPPAFASLDWDWPAVSARLKFLSVALEPFAISDECELAQHKVLHQRKRTGESLLTRATDWGMRDFAAPEEYQAELIAFNHDLTFCLQTAVDEVRAAITAKSLSFRFVRALTQLETLAMRRAVLATFQRQAQASFEKAIAAGSKSYKGAAQTWFARVVLQHAKPYSQTVRYDVEQAIAELCRKIVQQELRAPVGWDEGFFESMIEPEEAVAKHGKKAPVRKTQDGVPVYIISRFSRLSQNALQKLAANRLIKEDMLPPLGIVQFPPPFKGGSRCLR